ncbi:S1 family peptidase [Thiothrix winogradskyi]|uniref:Serine protease n=1 Tax=Thiothrix winogradskyi TaxID=96472 RepID=A0ABY3T1F9_9GAMM|nr:serine protease [Thiothrix winogradskyi]UJS24611.1 serine protease [Thiothrix winogradskyi]
MSELKFNPISQSSYFVTARFNEVELSTATAFFVVRNNKRFLITNWHVVSGRNSETGKCLAEKTAAIPNNLVIRVHKNKEHIEFEDFAIDLLNSETDEPLWLQHPHYGKSVDVAALEVDIPAHLLAMTVEEFIEPFNEETTESVADDVFILGYPFGISVGNIFPIWKRASVASEPIIDIDELPKILVDTASRQGMSGSPVILFKKRPVSIMDKHPEPTKISNYFMKLIGIYSGRIGASDDNHQIKAQLGIVWKAKVIDEIITQKIFTSDE